MTAITLLASFSFSLLGYFLTSSLIPRLSATLISAGLKGKDLLKGNSTGGGDFHHHPRSSSSSSKTTTANTPEQPGSDQHQFIPESTGLIAGSVYVLILCLFVPIPYYTHLLPDSFLPGSTAFFTSGPASPGPGPAGDAQAARPPFPLSSLTAHLASILSLLSAVFLGFLDDVFDIRWRFKLPIPIIASVPLLTVYAASSGSTDIIIPHIFGLRALFGVAMTNGLLSIGPLYYLYMSMLSTFCTNSINILAGINGVEVGQSLIICLSIICNDLLYIHLDLAELGLPHRLSFGFANGSKALEDRHLFSLCLMLPLFAVMLALIKFNWYPARAFVGDTFCYFAGMAFAVVGILGHFSKTLLLFFIPQILNFLYSSPQLFGILPISRHRLPSRDPVKNVLKPSIVLFKTPLPASPTLKSSLLKAFETLRLIQLVRNKHNLVVGCSNLTLLNLALIWLPGLNERQLSSTILAFQFFSNFFIGFFIRYFLADLFYDPRLR
ncbi:uncharacterized protein PGTG_13425 [Puccinia graminis f. sp. tritici CRL 75-36-700-3]|uniref:UDP-N-acetylglucosamine--dolichyl-phosphate N-acetylglucosaminephosphotransferase n=1 Tax=Puccinia graminis f. sp. tritici (strain CRL 75-36-700-3 / race SCCL) TaxID=418459 RepID=E3KTR8_PUCGT|nr:uncharacterized protein PGTG_13425 [Puccinia graminis f. sp. tritici CRL 75-36-700-3]EFP87639.2 hypothetical protein PGTG_13425 [Puccinia graminis f. sp. tritici CRL 75-36-700-3]